MSELSDLDRSRLAADWVDLQQVYVPPPLPPPPKDRVWLHWLLLAITVLTTTLIGGCHYAGFVSGFSQLSPSEASQLLDLSKLSFYTHGLWYSATILLILGCHEMGHYLTALRYGVDVSRPYFLPLPLPPPFNLTGTLGAFIRIRSRIPSRVALFDIGIAGPLAGFVIAVPALFIGLSLSTVVALPADMSGLRELGEPLLFKFASWLIWGPVPSGYSVNMHPMAFAAWFGLLMTAMNLFPIAQLDGGHITYAVLGDRATIVTKLSMVVAVGLVYLSLGWLLWAVLLFVMLRIIGLRHPPTLDDRVDLGRTRLVLAALSMVILVVSFTPVPLSDFIDPEIHNIDKGSISTDALRAMSGFFAMAATSASLIALRLVPFRKN